MESGVLLFSKIVYVPFVGNLFPPRSNSLPVAVISVTGKQKVNVIQRRTKSGLVDGIRNILSKLVVPGRLTRIGYVMVVRNLISLKKKDLFVPSVVKLATQGRSKLITLMDLVITKIKFFFVGTVMEKSIWLRFIRNELGTGGRHRVDLPYRTVFP